MATAAQPRCAVDQAAGIRAQVGYKRRPGSYGGKPSLAVERWIASSTLLRQTPVAAV